jgi:hypothetical protein
VDRLSLGVVCRRNNPAGVGHGNLVRQQSPPHRHGSRTSTRRT